MFQYISNNKYQLTIKFKTNTLRTPSNMFVVNLAVSDLVMMTTQGPPVMINGFMQRYWMWGKWNKMFAAFIF